jgi:uncharacterized membrane protein (UPF0127 family)
VEVAQTPEERELGLMNRSDLDKDSGMLFVFDESGVYPFWMKNTLIPLDAIWISSEYKVVDIQSMVPCPGDPCTIYAPRGEASYVLEVNSGWANTHHIQVGDSVSLFKDSGSSP